MGTSMVQRKKVGRPPQPGTVFKITPGGKLTTLHTFDGTDGAYPVAQMVQASNGEFYGTASEGGYDDNHGTIFKITSEGKFVTLYKNTGGLFPLAGLIQATNGEFYGTTYGGGGQRWNCLQIPSGGIH